MDVYAKVSENVSNCQSEGLATTCQKKTKKRENKEAVKRDLNDEVDFLLDFKPEPIKKKQEKDSNVDRTKNVAEVGEGDRAQVQGQEQNQIQSETPNLLLTPVSPQNILCGLKRPTPTSGRIDFNDVDVKNSIVKLSQSLTELLMTGLYVKSF